MTFRHDILGRQPIMRPPPMPEPELDDGWRGRRFIVAPKKRPVRKTTCAAYGCKKILHRDNSTSVCEKHRHSAMCGCKVCREKKGEHLGLRKLGR